MQCKRKTTKHHKNVLPCEALPDGKSIRVDSAPSGRPPFRQSGMLRWMSVPIPALEQVHAQVRAAIIHRRPIAALYRGRRRLLCPHLLGWNRQRRLQVLCYQYGGDSESGLMPAGASDNWRCLAVENLNQPEILDGPWQTAENHSRPQTCIEEVELDVDDYPETPTSPNPKSAKL
jgi:hypothetical protein